MEWSEGRRETLTRLACCVVAALVLWYALDRWWEKIPGLPPDALTWLGENKVQAIAAAAAVLYGISLAVFPSRADGKGLEDGPPEAAFGGYEPC